MGFLGLGGDKVTTTTGSIGTQDAAHVNSLRDQGQAAAEAARNTQIAGMDPMAQQALNNMPGQYDQWQQMAGMWNPMAAQALGYAGQQGTTGLNNWFDPYQQNVIDEQRKQYGYQHDQAQMQQQQQASQYGAYGGSRAAVQAGMAHQGINRDESSQIAQLLSQGYDMATARMLQDRYQQGQLGMGLAGLGQNAMGQAGAANQNMLAGGDYGRNVQNEIYGHDFQNQTNALGALGQSYGKDTSYTSENREEGSWLGDALGLATGIGSFFLPGAGAASSALGMLGGGGAQAQNAASPIMSGGDNIWTYNGGNQSLGGKRYSP